MRPIVQTLTNGQNLQVPLDMYLKPFQVSVDVVVTGTVTYVVHGSNDDPFSGSAPTNFIAPDPIASGSVSAQASITVPVRQLYVQVTAGTGSIALRVSQSGMLG